MAFFGRFVRCACCSALATTLMLQFQEGLFLGSLDPHVRSFWGYHGYVIRFLLLPAFGALLLTVSASAAQFPANRYDPLPKGELGGGLSRANACGSVVTSVGRATVGSALTLSGDLHAFYEDDSGLLDLGTFGGPNSEAMALSLRRDVVGWADSFDANGNVVPRAFSWHPSSGLTDLGDLGGARSWATGIDPYLRNICGHSENSNGDLRAFWIDFNTGTMRDCGDLGAGWSLAHATQVGMVVGESGTVSGLKHAFSWSVSGGMRDLGTLGGNTSVASAISINGYICGWSSNSNFDTHAVFFQSFPTTQVVDCGTLGGKISFGNSINNRAQIVGASELATGEWRAFLWDNATRTMVDLNDFIHPQSGWVLEFATHITDSGFISGSGTWNGQTTAFLLRPFSMSVVRGAGNTATFAASYLDPGQKVWFAGSLNLGSWTLPGFPGLTLGLANPQLVGSAITPGWGGPAIFTRGIPPSASGLTIHFQAGVPKRYLLSPLFTRAF